MFHICFQLHNLTLLYNPDISPNFGEASYKQKRTMKHINLKIAEEHIYLFVVLC
jgi:hypothetical protein